MTRPTPMSTTLYVILVWALAAPAHAGLCGDGATIVPIHQVQGAGAETPCAGETVRVDGVVTSRFTGADALTGFFLQEPDGDADASPATSEGIFVFCGAACPAALAVGQSVTVTGRAEEFAGTTQVNASVAGSGLVVGSAVALPATTSVALPASGPTTAAATFESLEGMLVTFAGPLVVTEVFDLARFGEIELVAGPRPAVFTQTNAPNAAGLEAFQQELAQRRIVLDDDNNDGNDPISNGSDEPYPYPEGGLSLTNRFRTGDTIADLSGVLQFAVGAWRIRPTPEVFDYAFTAANPRPAAPADVGGRLRVAGLNVLNYFVTIDTTSSSSSGSCGPAGTADCRGADSAAELATQRAKLVAALATIDADIVGLMEVENDGGAALADLVAALNAVAAEPYAYIDTGAIGSDAIKVGLIHRPGRVTPVGAHAVLDASDDPRFNDALNRPSLIQTFEEVATGERLTIAVNHLKSKGSSCGAGDDDLSTGQGNCNGTRTAAARALAAHLATDPTGSGDPDFLVIGDLNSYALEDPITALTTAGFTRLDGPDAYSFVFEGQIGALDHAFATASLAPQVTGVTEWHVNADEIGLFDYNDGIKDAGEAAFERESTARPLHDPLAAPDPFRVSDHDPIIVGLSLGGGLPLTKDQQKCAGALGKSFATLDAAVTKQITGCLQNNAKGKPLAPDDPSVDTVEECVIDDLKDGIAKAKAKAGEEYAKRCTGQDKQGADRLPPNGATDPDTIAGAAMAKSAALVHDVFGADLDAGVLLTDAAGKEGSTCQRGVWKALTKCEATKVQAFLDCKNTGLGTGTVAGAVDLVLACLTQGGDPATGQPDPKGKIAKACAGARGGIPKALAACSGPAPAVLFPGCPGSDPAACLDQRVECRVCRALVAAHALRRDCDRFDDGLANGSCAGTGGP